MKKLDKQLEFIIEIDKIKEIYRHTSLFGKTRKENDAEHSWHISVMAMVLQEYSNEKEINLLKVIKMLLIHDLVEIDAGDYIVYTEKVEEKKKKEEEGAKRIFGMLPNEQEKEFMELWNEFEERKTKESKFANVVDRFEPILQNYKNDGETWIKHGITSKQIMEKSGIIKEGSEEIWEYVKGIVEEFVRKGLIKE